MKLRLLIVIMVLVLGLGLTGCAQTLTPHIAPEEAEAQERYLFATEALIAWEKLESINIYTLMFEELSPVDYNSKFNNLNFEVEEIEYNLKWLYAPPDVIDIKRSLLGEVDIIHTCVLKAWAAVTCQYEGNEAGFKRYLDEVVETCNELPSKQIEQDLINLKLQAEKDLGIR